MKQHIDTYISPRISSAVQRLQWLVQFVEMDLEALRPWAWTKLKEDVAAFLRAPWHHLYWEGSHLQMTHDQVLVMTPEVDYPDATLRALHQDARTIIHDMVLASREGTEDPTLTVPLSLDLALDAMGDRLHKKPVLIACGAVRDLFLLVTFMLLKEVGTDHILRCPECGRLFYRGKNQRYCSRPCVNRVSQRRWQERHARATLTQNDQALASSATLGPAPGEQPADATAPAEVETPVLPQPLTGNHNARRTPVR
jgi:hypothetical protein